MSHKHAIKLVGIPQAPTPLFPTPLFSCFQTNLSAANCGWKTKESGDNCLYQKNGCHVKFDAKRWCYVGSAKSSKLAIDALVSG